MDSDPKLGTITVGRLLIDLDARKASVDGTTIPLTTKEYQILELLAVRRNRFTTTAFILDSLYIVHKPEPSIVKVFICKIRRKISDLTDGNNYIKTLYRRGYILYDTPRLP